MQRPSLYFSTEPFGFLSTDSEMMNQSAAYLKQVVDVAYDMECPTVIVGKRRKDQKL